MCVPRGHIMGSAVRLKGDVVNVVLSVANTPLQTENVSCVTTFQMHVCLFECLFL